MDKMLSALQLYNTGIRQLQRELVAKADLALAVKFWGTLLYLPLLSAVAMITHLPEIGWSDHVVGYPGFFFGFYLGITLVALILVMTLRETVVLLKDGFVFLWKHRHASRQSKIIFGFVTLYLLISFYFFWLTVGVLIRSVAPPEQILATFIANSVAWVLTMTLPIQVLMMALAKKRRNGVSPTEAVTPSLEA